ncbi:MAG TPA: hypothetical protein VKY26_07185 [Actinomycetota bacterium]|nr:hypothetical protein [Actinomycetota bacterium]
MLLIVWNSEGDRWDALWNHWVSKEVQRAQDTLLGLVIEAGWAPWVPKYAAGGAVADVRVNTEYALSSDYYDYATPPLSAFCQGMLGRPGKRTRTGRSALWIPWVKTFDALNVNARCSMGSLFCPLGSDRIPAPHWKARRIEGNIRPALEASLQVGGDVQTVVFLVHLASSARALTELNTLTDQITRLIPEDAQALVVGDMNVNILGLHNPKLNLGPHWSIARTCQPTQRAGGELDYALVYDRSRSMRVKASTLCRFDLHPNESDHSVMQYEISL